MKHKNITCELLQESSKQSQYARKCSQMDTNRNIHKAEKILSVLLQCNQEVPEFTSPSFQAFIEGPIQALLLIIQALITKIKQLQEKKSELEDKMQQTLFKVKKKCQQMQEIQKQLELKNKRLIEAEDRLLIQAQEIKILARKEKVGQCKLQRVMLDLHQSCQEREIMIKHIDKQQNLLNKMGSEMLKISKESENNKKAYQRATKEQEKSYQEVVQQYQEREHTQKKQYEILQKEFYQTKKKMFEANERLVNVEQQLLTVQVQLFKTKESLSMEREKLKYTTEERQEDTNQTMQFVNYLIRKVLSQNQRIDKIGYNQKQRLLQMLSNRDKQLKNSMQLIEDLTNQLEFYSRNSLLKRDKIHQNNAERITMISNWIPEMREQVDQVSTKKYQ